MNPVAQPPGRWQRRPDAQGLRWAAAPQLEQLRTVLEEAEAAWRAAWGIAATARPVRCADGRGHEADMDLQPLGGAGPAVAWIRWTQDPEAAPFAQQSPTPLARAARAACARDRAARLVRALGLQGEAGERYASPPAHRWGGGARASLSCGSELVVNGHCLAALAPPTGRASAQPPTVTALSTAAARLRVRVQARLADCTLDVGALQGLQPGDVVRLDHDLAAPLLVHAPDGAPMFSGFLSSRAGFKALELAAAPASHSTEAMP